MLPDDVDPELWFPSEACNGEADYLFDAKWNTWPGRMKAYCPHGRDWPDYRISVAELPSDLPVATRYWVRGFMAGNLPEPKSPDDARYMERWFAAAEDFSASGSWPSELLDPPSLWYQVKRVAANQVARVRCMKFRGHYDRADDLD